MNWLGHFTGCLAREYPESYEIYSRIEKSTDHLRRSWKGVVDDVLKELGVLQCERAADRRQYRGDGLVRQRM